MKTPDSLGVVAPRLCRNDVSSALSPTQNSRANSVDRYLMRTTGAGTYLSWVDWPVQDKSER